MWRYDLDAVLSVLQIWRGLHWFWHRGGQHQQPQGEVQGHRLEVWGSRHCDRSNQDLLRPDHQQTYHPASSDQRRDEGHQKLPGQLQQVPPHFFISEYEGEHLTVGGRLHTFHFSPMRSWISAKATDIALSTSTWSLSTSPLQCVWPRMWTMIASCCGIFPPSVYRSQPPPSGPFIPLYLSAVTNHDENLNFCFYFLLI